MAAFGFLIFGDHSSGFILNNYSTKDVLATICRVAIRVALVFTYPLPFLGFRMEYSTCSWCQQPSARRTTIVMLVLISLLATRFQDLAWLVPWEEHSLERQ